MKKFYKKIIITIFLIYFVVTVISQQKTLNQYKSEASDSSNIKNMQIHDMLVENHPDGVVCTDDLTAILVLQEAKKLGIKVPKELKVIGFDGTKLIQTYHSELTTIAQPIHDIATLLVDLLLKRIAHPDEELKQMNYTLPVKLIKSETTA